MTFSRTLGIRLKGGGIPEEVRPSDGKSAYHPSHWIGRSRAITWKTMIEGSSEMIHLGTFRRENNLVEDKAVDGPFRKKDVPPGKEVCN